MTTLFPVPEPKNVLRDDATLGTPAHEDPDMRPWTEDDVLRVLWRHFAAQSWCAIPQVTVAMRDLDPDAYRLSAWDSRRQDALAGVDPLDAHAAHTDRRIDMLLARKPPKRRDIGDLETLAVEVKVTRADFLNDIRHPEKQAPWRKAATRHAYAVPAGLVTADEVPEGSGLLVVRHGHGYGDAEWVKRAPYRKGHAPQLPLRAQVAILHRITTLEGHTRGWQHTPAGGGTDQEVRAALQAAQKAAERANRRAEKAEGKAAAWQTAYGLLATDGHPCRWCGNPVKPLNPESGRFRRWRHLDTAHDEPCRQAQEHVAEVEAHAAYDAATPEDRDRKAREAHNMSRDRFLPRVEAEPWRAYLPNTGLRYTGVLFEPEPPAPADVAPEGATP